MKACSPLPPWIGVLVAAAAVPSFDAIASAQDCASEADCRAGYVCKTESHESCSGYGMCYPDGSCTETEVSCGTVEYSYCTHAPCDTDADCPDSMACRAQTTWICDGGGAGTGAAGSGAVDGGAGVDCAPGEMCPEPDFGCHEEPAGSLCVPRYDLPCETASDCGGGFDCVESFYWECMGGAPAGGVGGTSSAGSGAEMTPVPAEPDAPQDAGVGEPGDARDGGAYSCEQIPSGERYCELQLITCATDAECPSGLECVEQYVYRPCGGSAGTGGSAGGSMDGTTTRDGGIADGASPDGGAYECPEPEIERRCMPPEWNMTPPPGSGAGGSGGGSTDAGTDTGGGSAGSFGNSGGSGGGGGSSSGAPGSGDPSDGDDEDEHGHGHGRGHWLLRHCAAGGPIGADPSLWLMLGLSALVLRRRARR